MRGIKDQTVPDYCSVLFWGSRVVMPLVFLDSTEYRCENYVLVIILVICHCLALPCLVLSLLF